VIFIDTIFFDISLALLAVLGVYEAIKAYGLGKSPYIFAVSMVWTALVFFVKDEKIIPLLWLALIGVYLLTPLFLQKNHSMAQNLPALFLTIAIAQVFLLVYPMKAGEYGVEKLVFTCACAFVSDILAQLVGSAIGKKKLCESISKNKTVEGFLAGLGGGALCGTALSVYMSAFLKVTADYVLFIFLGIFFSSISVLGDLVFSKIKRERGIKDFGNLLPGHGGMLDRLDSVLFLLPIAYVLFGTFNLF